MLAVKNDILAMLQEHVFYLAQPFIQPDTAIIDLSPGNGDMMAQFVAACPDDQKFIFVNPRESTEKRFSVSMRPVHHIPFSDVKMFYLHESASLIIAPFVLQNMALRVRDEFASLLHNRLIKGGACIVIENTLSISIDVNRAIHGAMHALDIDQPYYSKDACLLSTYSNEQMLRYAGFETVECVFKIGDITAWLAVRER